MSETQSQTLTADEVSALVGDDITFWLSNPFMTSDMLAEKVCWWVSRALSGSPAPTPSTGEASA